MNIVEITSLRWHLLNEPSIDKSVVRIIEGLFTGMRVPSAPIAACAVSCTDVALAGGHLLRGTYRCCLLVALARAWHGHFALAGRYSTTWNP